MNKLRYIFILLVAVLFVACDDDFKTPPVATAQPGTAPVLNDVTDVIDLVLLKKNEKATIVDISWSASTYPDNIGVRYHVQIDTVGNNFASPLELDRISDTEMSIKVGELNTLLSKRYKPAEKIELDIRVRAHANEDLADTYTSHFTIKVTPYLDVPVPAELYLFGKAIAGGTDIAQALKAYGKDDVFTKYVSLTKDSVFKFSEKQEDGGYDYNFGKLATVSDNIVSAGDEAGNFKFTGETGWYEVKADFVNSVLTVAPYVFEGNTTYTATPDNIYLVGDYNDTDDKWSPATGPAFTKLSDGIYQIEATLKDGALLKFVGQQSWGDLDWGNLGGDGNTGIVGPKGKNGNISFDGGGKSYIIKIDLNKGVYTITESAIFIVGDATEAGWDINAAIEIKYNKGHNAYFGYIPLKSGEFKFFPVKGSWNNGMGRESETADNGVLGGENKNIPSPNTTSDYKLYRVSVWYDDNAGVNKYSVIPAEMVLVGDATPAGWSIDNGYNMVYAGEGKWVTYVDMNATGGYKFFYQTGNWGSGYKEFDATNKPGELSIEGGDPNISTPGAGYYKLTIDTYNMTYTKELMSERKMFLVGSVNGWNIDAGIEMTWNDTNKEWTLTRDLAADDAFKVFAKSGDWNSGFKFKWGTLNFEGGDPNISTPDGAGNYTFKFSLAKRTLTITKN